MQTVENPAVPSGARQEPLRSAEQLAPGVILTGEAWRNGPGVRRVVEVDGNTVVLEYYPTPSLAAGHLHGFTLLNNTQCSCGLRRQLISGLLPRTGEAAVRTYCIIPEGVLRPADIFTIYVGPRGKMVRAQAQQWSEPLPVIPKLYPAWTLPDALRRLAVQEGLAGVREEEEEE
jgi:hypothetical protein